MTAAMLKGMGAVLDNRPYVTWCGDLASIASREKSNNGSSALTILLSQDLAAESPASITSVSASPAAKADVSKTRQAADVTASMQHVPDPMLTVSARLRSDSPTSVAYNLRSITRSMAQCLW